MKLYTYYGTVMEFDHIVAERWYGETIASSKAKARSNLAYQFKQQTNRTANTVIKLPGELLEFDF